MGRVKDDLIEREGWERWNSGRCLGCGNTLSPDDQGDYCSSCERRREQNERE